MLSAHFIPLLVSLLVPLLAHGQQPARILTGTAVRVVDGNTIHVRLGHRVETVRYIGVNAPGLHQPGGREAAEANRKLVEGQPVRLELDVQERDKDGRLAAYMYVGDVMVNEELVANGYARATTSSPNVKHQELFGRRQREARLLQLGIWKGTSQPPSPAAASAPRSKSHQASANDVVAQQAQGRPGVPPQEDGRSCPTTHPIKGNFTTVSGERCIYHPPGGEFYTRTNPERCYASGEEAAQDGCRATKR